MWLSTRSIECKETTFFPFDKTNYIQMRRDCMQFEAAMTLAKAYDPEQIPYISSSHAEQLEFT